MEPITTTPITTSQDDAMQPRKRTGRDQESREGAGDGAGGGHEELESPLVAAFTMEVGIESDLPTYSGGLGVLAGDTVRAAADLDLPFVMVTLVHRAGYFRQTLEEDGRQVEEPATWRPEERLIPLEPRVTLEVEGRPVVVRGWEHPVRGVTGAEVPVIFLDTDLPENDEEARRITDRLYGGDARLRLTQEAILGMGGVRYLRALGMDRLETFHMNEGHSALLVLELLEELGINGDVAPGELAAAVDRVRARCVFTTHTPVPAGHDRFPLELLEEVLGGRKVGLLEATDQVEDGELNMTHLALHFARYTNGVALRHARVSREMFPGHTIHAITNGVHAPTWTGPAFRELFDRHMPGWREDPYLLRHAVAIPLPEIREAHRQAKVALLEEVEARTGRRLAPDRLTMVFARRAAPYKRADLLVSDLERLRDATDRGTALQMIYAGKAHPRDERGKEIIRRVIEAGRELGDELPLVYLEDYDMHLGALLTAGADLWLNQPRKPMEASGTSGMKAALNGVPCLSILDGWWIEGHVEGVTGWAIDETWEEQSDDELELDSTLRKLKETILPLFYEDPDGWTRVMRWSVALNGSFFHARRMLQEYVDLAYRLRTEGHESPAPPAPIGAGSRTHG
jgi:glycogen phosphorylase